jgi:hypothetical protein
MSPITSISIGSSIGSSISSISISSISTNKKAVTFGDHIRITEFPLILGNNPACSSGAPVQLSPRSSVNVVLLFDIYDSLRREQRERRSGGRTRHSTTRKYAPLVRRIPVATRGEILLQAGYSLDEIGMAVMEINHIQKLRRETIALQGWSDRFNSILESTGKLPKDLMNGVLAFATGKKIIVKPVQMTLQARSA